MSAELDADEVVENSELVLFQVKECYVYMIPPRKSSSSFRADDWNINKWVWEGGMKIVAKGEQCSIKLQDSKTGELYAEAPVRKDEPLPIEPVIDSSRYFVLRIEDAQSSGRARHAFIGIGFRERTEAYDFQAALQDHVSYLNKKKEAEELEKEYQSKPAVDYSLKEGETLRLQLKTVNANLSAVSARRRLAETTSLQKTLPPPPCPGIVVVRSLSGTRLPEVTTEAASGAANQPESNVEQHEDDDFGDFQTA